MTAVATPASVRSPQLLRFATAGSVDDGKSTLIGRLLYDSKSLLADQVADAELDLARLTDGLRAEREQGITIDVAYRHFSTPRRRFIIADTPGHAQYTRNMVTGASTADVAVVLVDAREGLLTQSRRHAAIAGLLRIPRIVLAVNKMDLVGVRAGRVPAHLRGLPRVGGAARRRGDHLHPDLRAGRRQRRRAVDADGLVPRADAAATSSRPRRSPAGVADGPLRFPVQYVIRSGEQRALRRADRGRVSCGSATRSVVLPGGLRTRVAAVEGPDGPLDAAAAPLSVAVSLEDELDVGRGALICDAGGTAAVGARHRARRSAGWASRPAAPAAGTCSSTRRGASGCGSRSCTKRSTWRPWQARRSATRSA